MFYIICQNIFFSSSRICFVPVHGGRTPAKEIQGVDLNIDFDLIFYLPKRVIAPKIALSFRPSLPPACGWPVHPDWNSILGLWLCRHHSRGLHQHCKPVAMDSENIGLLLNYSVTIKLWLFLFFVNTIKLWLC